MAHEEAYHCDRCGLRTGPDDVHRWQHLSATPSVNPLGTIALHRIDLCEQCKYAFVAWLRGERRYAGA
jgi:hypothetical protein